MKALIANLIEQGIPRSVLDFDAGSFFDGSKLHKSKRCFRFPSSKQIRGRKLNLLELDDSVKRCPDCTGSDYRALDANFEAVFSFEQIVSTLAKIKDGEEFSALEIFTSLQLIQSNSARSSSEPLRLWLKDASTRIRRAIPEVCKELKTKEADAMRAFVVDKLFDEIVSSITLSEEDIRILPPEYDEMETLIAKSWQHSEKENADLEVRAEIMAEEFYEICPAPELEMLPSRPSVAWSPNSYFPDWVAANWYAAVEEICQRKVKEIEEFVRLRTKQLLELPKDHLYIRTDSSDYLEQWSLVNQDLVSLHHFTGGRVSSLVGSRMTPYILVPASDAPLEKVFETAYTILKDRNFADEAGGFLTAMALESSS